MHTIRPFASPAFRAGLGWQGMERQGFEWRGAELLGGGGDSRSPRPRAGRWHCCRAALARNTRAGGAASRTADPAARPSKRQHETEGSLDDPPLQLPPGDATRRHGVAGPSMRQRSPGWAEILRGLLLQQEQGPKEFRAPRPSVARCHGRSTEGSDHSRNRSTPGGGPGGLGATPLTIEIDKERTSGRPREQADFLASLGDGRGFRRTLPNVARPVSVMRHRSTLDVRRRAAEAGAVLVRTIPELGGPDPQGTTGSWRRPRRAWAIRSPCSRSMERRRPPLRECTRGTQASAKDWTMSPF
jgi:hypothetical protein